MIHFLGNEVIGPLMQVEHDEPYREYLEEYRRLGDNFHSAMSFPNLCNIKSRNRLRGPVRPTTQFLVAAYYWEIHYSQL
jgi:hypothetical protein